MTGNEIAGAVQGWRRQILMVLVFYCTTFTALSAINELAHAFAGSELKSTAYRYAFPLLVALLSRILARLFGTADSTV